MLVNTSQDSKEIQRSDEQSIKTLHNHNPNKQKSSKHVLLEKSAPSALLPQGNVHIKKWQIHFPLTFFTV